MGKASRSKRNRAVRSAKRSRNNSWWYGLIAVVLIAGMGMVVYARQNVAPAVGPFIHDSTKSPTSKENLNSHWHAALGVYDCDHWLGQGGDGIWPWPSQITTPNGQSPGRVGTNIYAGLHSHDDGIIHMEPAVTDEAGKNATVGKYFTFGGWKLSSSGYDFLGTKVSNGDKCNGKPGKLTWAVAKFPQGGDVKAEQKYVVKSGNPGSYKLDLDDVVIIAFLPEGKTIASIGNPPSLANLPDAANNEGQTPKTTMPSPETTSPSQAATVPPTTSKP